MSNRKKHSNKNASQAWTRTALPSMHSLRILAGVGAIVLLTILVYFPALRGGFIWDDDLHLTNNPLIKSSAGFYQFWSAIEKQVWPVSNASLWLEWRLWGMNPTGYHVTNLILHIVETLLIWAILRKLSIPGAFLAAMIFAVHPVNVESVAWIAQRKNLLAMLFFLLAILCYLKGDSPSPLPQSRLSPLMADRWYWLSFSMFVLGMFGKGSVVVLPVLLLGIIWWRRMGTVPIFASAKMGLSPSVSRRDLLRIAPFFLVAVILTGVNLRFQTYIIDGEIRYASFIQRLLGAGGVVWFYLYKALLPLNLVFVYPEWHIEAGNLLWWLPLVAAVVVTMVLWRYRAGWSRPFLFAWGYFCVALVPVMGFANVYFMIRYSLVADHYQHIAIIGVIALVAAGFGNWHARLRGGVYWAATAVAIMAVGAITFLTWQQCEQYRDVLKLYQVTLEKNPDCLLAHINLGVALVKTGRPQEAIEHYRQALRINPDFPSAHNNLGNVLFKLGRVQEAIKHYQQALQFKPDLTEAYSNLGGALVKAGHLKEAIKCYQQALLLEPEFTEIHYNLAEAYASMHRSSEAIAAAQKALELARSQGQTALAEQIEDWLTSYRAGLPK